MISTKFKNTVLWIFNARKNALKIDKQSMPNTWEQSRMYSLIFSSFTNGLTELLKTSSDSSNFNNYIYNGALSNECINQCKFVNNMYINNLKHINSMSDNTKKIISKYCDIILGNINASDITDVNLLGIYFCKIFIPICSKGKNIPIYLE